MPNLTISATIRIVRPTPRRHLIREASLDRAVTAFPEAATINERSIETIERIGLKGWRALEIDVMTRSSS